MDGKVVVVTGATSGIGEVAAGKLASMGARVIAIARDRARGEATLARLRQMAPGLTHGVYYADLSVLAEMKRVAAEIAAVEPRIDVLINNAGAAFDSRQLTPDGMERTFATNHMAYFVVTHGLRERLLAAAPARVISTSSEAHRRTKIDFTDLQAARDFGGLKAYGRSKLCNILFTRELARRLSGTGVTANCLHPGFVNTRIGDNAKGVVASLFRLAKKFALTPEKGAETIVFLASAKEVAGVTGGYFYQCRPNTPSPEAQDDQAARQLWEKSEELAASVLA
jgi:NAD(P)-dependent dehydrogenase (short-subunit alcohol dehydrogenase family)